MISKAWAEHGASGRMMQASTERKDERMKGYGNLGKELYPRGWFEKEQRPVVTTQASLKTWKEPGDSMPPISFFPNSNLLLRLSVAKPN